MTPSLIYPHKSEPGPKTPELLLRLTALRDGARNGSPLALPISASAKQWLEKVQDKRVVAPQQLVTALDSLLAKIMNNGDISSETEVLFAIGVLRVSTTGWTLAPIETGAAAYAIAVLKQLRLAYISELAAAAAKVWNQAAVIWDEASQSRTTSIKSLLGVSAGIGSILCMVNAPEVYYFFESLLSDYRPEIRNKGAFWLRYWRSDTLLENLLNALILGNSDPRAYSSSKYIFQLIIDLEDVKALPVLQGLLGSAVDDVLLQRAIATCAKTIPYP